MKHIAFILLAAFAASSAHASFADIKCSSPDGKAQFKMKYPATPGYEKIWIIDGIEYYLASRVDKNGDLIEASIAEERLTPPQNLETISQSNPPGMSSRNIVTYKVGLAYTNDEGPKVLETWVICDSATGL